MWPREKQGSSGGTPSEVQPAWCRGPIQRMKCRTTSVAARPLFEGTHRIREWACGGAITSRTNGSSIGSHLPLPADLPRWILWVHRGLSVRYRFTYSFVACGESWLANGFMRTGCRVPRLPLSGRPCSLRRRSRIRSSRDPTILCWARDA